MRPRHYLGFTCSVVMTGRSAKGFLVVLPNRKCHDSGGKTVRGSRNFSTHCLLAHTTENLKTRKRELYGSDQISDDSSFGLSSHKNSLRFSFVCARKQFALRTSWHNNSRPSSTYKIILSLRKRSFLLECFEQAPWPAGPAIFLRSAIR